VRAPVWCAWADSLLPVRILVRLHMMAMHGNTPVLMTQKYTPQKQKQSLTLIRSQDYRDACRHWVDKHIN
jgi:hypothetical protein